ncbi:MAG TPA: copper-binding protein [Terriglobales bacterium]|nr:copper-binding protein [Terriglobales bacterium]
MATWFAPELECVVSNPMKCPSILASLLMLLVSFGAFSSCHRSNPPTTKRYPFTGRVISIDSTDQTALIDGNAVPGFMDAMTMSYKIKPSAELSQLTAGDSISAEVVVVETDAKNESPADYWLENVKVTGHAPSPHGPGAYLLPMPPSGEDVRYCSCIDHGRFSAAQWRQPSARHS